MEKQYAQRLVEAGQAEGLDVELYEGYSGRGMYGSETTGISCSFAELAQCAALAAHDMPEGELEYLVIELGKLRYDSLGRGMIFY